MPRQARLDAAGVLHHVMGRGVERRKIFWDDRDREDFLRRLAGLSEKGAWIIYAWVGYLGRTSPTSPGDGIDEIITGLVSGP